MVSIALRKGPERAMVMTSEWSATDQRVVRKACERALRNVGDHKVVPKWERSHLVLVLRRPMTHEEQALLPDDRARQGHLINVSH